jgi:hypothetical protein
MTDRPKIKSITTGKPAKGVEKEAPVTRKQMFWTSGFCPRERDG